MRKANDPELVERITAAVLRLDGRREGGEVRFRCPEPTRHANGDAHPSARWNAAKGVWRCDACGLGGSALALARLLSLELPGPRGHGKGGGAPQLPPGNTSTVQPGLTLAEYAAAKALPVDFLVACGLSDVHVGHPCVRIPYFDEHGNEVAVRFRVALSGDRFRWKRGSKPTLYGLNRLAQASTAGRVVLVEGESDAHTLWHHGFPAIGLPGAGTWRPEWASVFDRIGTIFIIIEPDAGGAAVLRWVADAPFRDRVRLVALVEKDPSGLYLADRAAFRERFEAALAAARPFPDAAEAERQARQAAAWAGCESLARSPRILSQVVATVRTLGVVGERRAIALLFLSVVSRLLDRPVSVAVKGPSSCGKSRLAETVLRLFGPSAFYALSAMSERALAYSEEPLKHRMLVLYEAAGLQGDFASYLVRSLLSEGQLRYETVEKTPAGLRPRVIEREGPTGLLVTTTALRLHPENETRLLSIPVTDTQEQTRAVLSALATDVPDVGTALERWHAFDQWLEAGERRVVIPFALRLVAAVPPVALRLRRDVGQVLALVKAHALMHRASRSTDNTGRIVATLADYAAVRRLVEPLISAGVGATVPATVRDTVEAVRELGGEDVTGAQVATRLKLDKSAASRRIARAVSEGYLVNREDRKGRPARLVLGDPVPDDAPLLPPPRTLRDTVDGCTVARLSMGTHEPPSPCAGNGASRPPSTDDEECEWRP